MIITFASGKGGTGKTTISTSLALSFKENIQFMDCDVEEPNAHIYLHPNYNNEIPVHITVPNLNKTKCTFCGKCENVCAFNAIVVLKNSSNKNIITFPELCHGCGACNYFCPEGAISETQNYIGKIQTGEIHNMEFINGTLEIGAPMSPPIIRQMKTLIDTNKTVIIDAPPGTACPFITTLKDTDYCVLVTEPTPFGLSDLIMAINVIKESNIPYGIIINRCNIGDNSIEEYCKNNSVPVLARIPFKKKIALSCSRGIPLVKAFPEYKKTFRNIITKIKESI